MGDWVPNGYVSVKQAAEALSVTDKTVRRRIERGEIPAEEYDSPFGRSWIIPVDKLGEATRTVDVVEVEQRVTADDFKRELSDMIDRTVEEKVEKIAEENRRLHEENARKTDELLRVMQELQEEKKQKDERPFWKRLLGIN